MGVFDNPEKLFILLVIALLIFGPSKLAGLGGAIGKTIREFRGAVRGAQDSLASEIHQVSSEFEAAAPALPSPDSLLSPQDVPAPPPGPSDRERSDSAPSPSQGDVAASSYPDQSSLTSEPTAEALHKSLSGRA